MDLHFETVTAENRRQMEALRLFPNQKGFVESVADCLTEADESDRWRPVGIYDRQTLVGFAMYGFFPEASPAGQLWLDRLLIDRQHQGKGYGSAALSRLLPRLTSEYRKDTVYLSVYDTNRPAIRLYEKFGFRFNGAHDINGEKVMVYHPPTPLSHAKKASRLGSL